ncbi:HGGxSTG domain-containing protein [Pseudogemmobacter sp. W21_MBD1_M6]|uniref:HGGxSTG domain-containing protein n=1 Tax=Pseudogemmobacter sp. W21_MBD1_M6 TaxID=3240271 RepID=UPI003F9C6E5B
MQDKEIFNPYRRECPYFKRPHQSCGHACFECDVGECRRFFERGLSIEGHPLPPKERPRCDAATKQLFSCRNPVVPGKRRCKFHGGASTGPKTPEGRQRISEAQKLRWAKVHYQQAAN